MADFNKIIFLGHLTVDPISKSNGQLSVFSIACNRRGKKRDGTVVEDTCFLDVEAWSSQAEIAVKYLKKGMSVLLEGRLKQSSWQAQDGTSKSKLVMVCESIIFVDQPKENVSKGKDNIKKAEPVEENNIDEVPF